MPEWDKCYGLYTRGPCDERMYVILPKDTQRPICKFNSCAVHKKVLYNQSCILLGGPCGDFNHGIYEIDEITSDITCVLPLSHTSAKTNQRMQNNF